MKWPQWWGKEKKDMAETTDTAGVIVAKMVLVIEGPVLKEELVNNTISLYEYWYYDQTDQRNLASYIVDVEERRVNYKSGMAGSLKQEIGLPALRHHIDFDYSTNTLTVTKGPDRVHAIVPAPWESEPEQRPTNKVGEMNRPGWYLVAFRAHTEIGDVVRHNEQTLKCISISQFGRGWFTEEALSKYFPDKEW